MITLLCYFLFGPGKYNEMQRNGLDKSIIKRTSDNFAKAFLFLVIIDVAMYVILRKELTPRAIKIAFVCLAGIMAILLLIWGICEFIKLQRNIKLMKYNLEQQMLREERVRKKMKAYEIVLRRYKNELEHDPGGAHFADLVRKTEESIEACKKQLIR
jgi:uncharacterized protein YacL